MEEVYKWLEKINEKHPAFDASTHVPLTVKHPDKTVKELWKLLDDKE